MHVITLHCPKGGAGRSFVALALASALAAGGERVLVVEARRAAHFRFWVPWFADQDPACPLSRRIALAQARSDRGLAQMLRRARREGFDAALVDLPAAEVERREPLVHAALAEAHLILLPFIGPLEARLARAEIDALGLPDAAGVATNAPSPLRPSMRAPWADASHRLMRTALPPSGVELARAPDRRWPHALHASLLDCELTRPRTPPAAEKVASGSDLTALLDGPSPDLQRLEALTGLVRAANRLAAEVAFRIDGLALAPIEDPEGLRAEGWAPADAA